MCADDAWLTDLERYRAEYQADSQAYPFLGPAMGGVTPCAFWPELTRQQLPSLGRPLRMLLINSVGDPATPYHGALATRKLLPRSRLVTVPVSHHAVLGEYPSPCVERTAGDYLTTGLLPARDRHCPATASATSGTADLAVRWGIGTPAGAGRK